MRTAGWPCPRIARYSLVFETLFPSHLARGWARRVSVLSDVPVFGTKNVQFCGNIVEE